MDRYMTYKILDPRFRRLIVGSAQLEKLYTGMRWAEGPVYVPAAKSLLWSDIPNNRLMRFDETDGSVSIFESPCGNHNGHTLDHEGRVIACEHSGRRVSRLEHDGRWTTLVDSFQGKRLNSPNDVVVKRDGTIWFSDPTYGIDSEYEGDAAPSEIGASNVYRLDLKTGEITAVVTDLLKPNGLAFSPDEDLLYVADTGQTHDPSRAAEIVAYKVSPDGRTVTRRDVFSTLETGLYDGFRVDRAGNVWTSANEDVACYAPDGTLIGLIPIGETVANLTFGGAKRNRLYI
ncbi:MAG TPA: SMP-30/gluconolactonase/LRE family protein, partial [Acidisoma sp.]|uniref:SMP-30/gluconolactonase/LRE family protein n=1 Tax=Acidisoma sp. TaxID=1872115 RepID=UPI002B54A2B8